MSDENGKTWAKELKAREMARTCWVWLENGVPVQRVYHIKECMKFPKWVRYGETVEMTVKKAVDLGCTSCPSCRNHALNIFAWICGLTTMIVGLILTFLLWATTT